MQKTSVQASEPRDHPDVIAPPPLIFGAAFGLGYLLHYIYPLHPVPDGLTDPVGWSLIAVSLLIAATGFRALKRAGTHVDPYKPTTTLVTNGPYRFTRNPLYVASTLLYLGFAIWLNLLWPVVILLFALVIIHFGVIRCEERYLGNKFGSAFDDYCRRVRRWL